MTDGTTTGLVQTDPIATALARAREALKIGDRYVDNLGSEEESAAMDAAQAAIEQALAFLAPAVDERHRFEAWADGKVSSLHRRLGTYVTADAQRSWEAWRVARSLRTVPIAGPEASDGCYSALDAAVCDAIRCLVRPGSLVDGADIRNRIWRDHPGLLTKEQWNTGGYVVDRRLQVLRKAGRVTYNREMGWSLA